MVLNITRHHIFRSMLVIIFFYFISKETGCVWNVIINNPGGCLGGMLGSAVGTFIGGAFALYPYLIVRKLLLKINFPEYSEIINLILYSAIVISAIRSIPK